MSLAINENRSSNNNPGPCHDQFTKLSAGRCRSTAAKPVRLMSLDALRGFDMFWIIGADALVEGLPRSATTAWFKGWHISSSTSAGPGSISRT